MNSPMNELNSALQNFVLAPRDPQHNYQLAYQYEVIGQFAAAISYYLRCAELCEDEKRVYECLLNVWHCVNQVGDRPLFERGQLMTAIAQSPQRPEAYFFLCQWLERHGAKKEGSIEEMYKQIYMYANIGLANICHRHAFNTFNRYPGDYALMFYKGFAAWHVGKVDESVEIMKNCGKTRNSTVNSGSTSSTIWSTSTLSSRSLPQRANQNLRIETPATGEMATRPL